MNTILQVIILVVLGLVAASCGTPKGDERFIRQKIPVVIEAGKPIAVEIRSLSGGGENHVGIRCSPDIWNALTNGPESVDVRLKFSTEENTRIDHIEPGRGGRWPIENYHYLFYVHGEREARAEIQITFHNAPPGQTQAEILVLKTPADTIRLF